MTRGGVRVEPGGVAGWYSQWVPEQPPANEPPVDDRTRHLNRCSPDLRPVLDRLDNIIRNNFPDVKDKWHPEEYVGYWIGTHVWITIHTNWTLLWLRWRLQKAFQLPPDLAGQLGVSDEDVWIGKPDNPTGMKGVHVRIEAFPDPEALRRFLEALLRFLREAHGSALNVW